MIGIGARDRVWHKYFENNKHLQKIKVHVANVDVETAAAADDDDNDDDDDDDVDEDDSDDDDDEDDDDDYDDGSGGCPPSFNTFLDCNSMVSLERKKNENINFHKIFF